MHFDKSTNLFHQIQGTKRFHLLAKSVKIYPSMHPHYHQTAGNENTMAKDVEIIELGPGETLYIPPYVFHRVECLSDLCVSISSHTPSGKPIYNWCVQFEFLIFLFFIVLIIDEEYSYSIAAEIAQQEELSLHHFPISELCAVYRKRWEHLNIPSTVRRKQKKKKVLMWSD
jgi:hypothetical protein